MRRVGSTAQRLREKPYEKRVCRVESYPSCLMPEGSYTGPSVEEYVGLIHQAGVEMQVVAGEMDRGTPRFHSKMVPPHPNVDRDRLPRFLELAHEKGIIVLTYYPMNNIHPLKKIHPEWLMKFIDDGKPQPENPGWVCFNSPYRDWVVDYLSEYLDNLDLDGFYFDDMNWGSHDERPFYPSCCCEYCEELFRRETGLKIPTKVDFDSIDFKHFVNWRYDKMRNFIAYVTRKVRERFPDAILDYQYYERPETIWSDGHPLNPLNLEKVGAHFFIETHRTVRESSFTAKVARANREPFALWRGFPQQLQEHEPLSPIIHGLAAMVNGGRPVYGGGPIMRSVFSELKKRVDYIEGETVKYVALHISQQTRDFHPSSMSQDYWEMKLKSVKGTFEMLNQSHLLVDIVFDEQLTYERLSQYKVLFLSNSACLSDQQCEEVRRFVKAGGTLIATHETSLYDELGRRRDNFLMSDVFGVNYLGQLEGGSIHGVVYVPHDEVLSREFGYVISFAAEESKVSLRQDADVEVLCTKSSLKREPVHYTFDPKVNYDSHEPTVTVHRFGEGKAVYINGDVGGGYLHDPYPPLKRFIANLVRRIRPPIEVEAPKTIEVTAATRGSKEIMIHLLNNPIPLVPYRTPKEDLDTHFYLEEVNPIRNIRIMFNDFKVKDAKMPLQDLSLSITVNPQTVLVPEVKLHEVVILKMSH